MGCGTSTVAANDSSRSYRKVSKISRINQEHALTYQSPPFSRANTLTGKGWQQSKCVTEKERKKLEKEFVTEALNAHNEYRARHGVPGLKFSKSLSAHAQKWADELAKKDMLIHSKCVLPSGEIVGENIYMCWSSNVSQKAPVRDAVRSWYDKQSIYDYEKASFSYKTGHFTQVVWRDTKTVGIAWAKSNEGSFYVVANYSPAGNVHGTFEQNVPPPLCLDTNNNDNVDMDSLENDEATE